MESNFYIFHVEKLTKTDFTKNFIPGACDCLKYVERVIA